jgi:uncharacterized protein YjiS (DUF1127 family)
MTTSTYTPTAIEIASGETASGLTGLIARIRRHFAEQRMRNELALLDDAMLRDIGISEDEIFRVRNYESFTPRAWQSRQGV